MEVLLVVLGAVVGGAASLVGSLLVNRGETVRAARIRMYRDLLPPLLDLVPSVGLDDLGAVEALYRESRLARHRERQLADVVAEAWRVAVLTEPGVEADDEGRLVRMRSGDVAMTQERFFAESEAQLEFVKALGAIEKHLERKLR